jgi:hypothetical protein
VPRLGLFQPDQRLRLHGGPEAGSVTVREVTQPGRTPWPAPAPGWTAQRAGYGYT